ncbi:hypothetical protein FN846DRAFT_123999 [Sphaerosporella brunnea]|uniref:Uncharacterized protein n=1 Tax=Sphaerosporella brunnea TaxID=1250544 RepID=A0A5J5EQZ2_9PEZI|nr:hypothetical protein FN846DRAFT_123999 [Sphaerosporella brunnea]
MPLACLHFSKLSSHTKTITRFRKLSLKLNLRGMLKTGSPAILLLSAPPRDIPALQEAVVEVRRSGARDVDLYYGRIEHALSVNFEKENGVKRVKHMGQILDACQEFGVGGDVVRWIRDGVQHRRPLWRLDEFDTKRPVQQREERLIEDGADPTGMGKRSLEVVKEREEALVKGGVRERPLIRWTNIMPTQGLFSGSPVFRPDPDTRAAEETYTPPETEKPRKRNTTKVNKNDWVSRVDGKVMRDPVEKNGLFTKNTAFIISHSQSGTVRPLLIPFFQA